MTNFHVLAGANETAARPIVRRIDLSDLGIALRRGLDDFRTKPSHYAFLCLIYPVVGVLLAFWTSGNNALPLLFPLMSGFALLGPFAAIGLYEISRRRELGLDASWRNAFAVLRSPSIPSIAALGLLLMALFVCWLLAAQGLYEWLFGPLAPVSAAAFFGEVFTTERGWTLLVLGNLIGLGFAIAVLICTVVAFPLLLDRDIGAARAVETSARAVMTNPVPMAIWGLIVALALVVGTLPLFVGLAVVIPILGHSTWHLYRRVVEPEPSAADRIGVV